MTISFMKDSASTSSQPSPQPAAPQDTGFSPFQRLKSKRISYLTLPLLVMATVVEFVILATGWKYQQTVCLPQGMGVTFFGIGPIGATILACELLKLPLAIWTASRHGWQKGFMLVIGLPLICVLTFQLVKDMAVYEMGTAMLPANQMLEKAAAEETKISQLNGELAAIEGKRAERERKLAEVTAKQAKAKAELEDALKRNEAARLDAITLTDYQKKELSEVESRQANIIKQFDSDTAQLTKSIADLRVRREAEFARSSKDSKDWETRKAAYDAAYGKWHTEEARIDNTYTTAMADHANKKAAYEKDKAEYAAASFLKRQLMKEPVDPGVSPVREANKFPKPAELDGRPSALIAEIDEQLKAKEAELLAVNNKRRERIAQVDADARRLREEFDRRSTTKREEIDRKREELTSALAALVAQGKAEAETIDKDFAAVVPKVDSIRAEVDACRKKAEGFYEAREAAIRKTQVHRIATTVEIVRGLLMGERPMSIKATAKERGDVLTDQISMVRIWVYPVLAFIVAFLPTLMVEIGFSTVFEPDRQRPSHRLGFLGRRMHSLYIRAGRLKVLRAERLASEASAAIAGRDQALAAAKEDAGRVAHALQTELESARQSLRVAEANHQQQLRTREAEYAEQARKQETEWMSKTAALADSLNHAIVEKDAMRDLQKSEIERQVQLRQSAWAERLAQLRAELDDQRAAAESERATLMQQHHQKLMGVSEACRAQVLEANREKAEAELTAAEKTARATNELKEALHAREAVESQLKHEAEAFAMQLAQIKEDAARELEKVARQEKHRLDREQLEHKLQLEAKSREADARLKQELQEQELSFHAKLKQREQELSIKAEARETELQNQWASDLRSRQEEWELQTESRIRATEARLTQELQQKDELGASKLRQREQQWQARLDALRAELQANNEEVLRRREVDSDARLHQLEVRLREEMAQQQEAMQSKAKQREQELADQLAALSEAHQAAQAQWDAESEKKARVAMEPVMARLDRAEKEREEARQSAAESARHAQKLEKKLAQASSFLNGWRNGNNLVEPNAAQPGKTDWVLE